MTRQLDYRPRIVDAELSERLAAVSTVVVEGPKACGKTATASRQAASEVLLDIDDNARRAAELDPGLVLAGERPRLIDEWQTVPEVWNHIRRASDTEPGPGRFILTGSAVPADDITRHSGAGRVSRMRMRPMSLCELGVSGGQISLGGLLASDGVSASAPDVDVPELAELVCRGGWPGVLDVGLAQAMRFSRDYLDEIRRTDVQRLTGNFRDPNRLLRLIRSLARNVATPVSIKTLAADTGGDGRLHAETVSAYLDALERLFVVEDVPAYSKHLRSRSQLRKSPKRYFVDPSLAVAALRSSPQRLLGDLKMFGFLFESLVIRDLRVYAQANDAEVYHYRDNTGLETDAVVETLSGSWMAVEVKLGGKGPIDAAAAALLKLRNRVDTSRNGEPAKLVVITGTGYGYERSDGVAVVPLAALGP